MEFLGKHQKKIAIGVGAVAVIGGLVTFDAESYMTHFFGLATIHDSTNHVHDAVKHAHGGLTVPSVHQNPALAEHANHSQATAGQANVASGKHNPASQPISHKTEEAEGYNFNAKPGASITGEFQAYAADHGKHLSALKAYDIYLNLKQKLGGHLAHRQIILANGDIGLPKGHDSLSPETVKLLKQYI